MGPLDRDAAIPGPESALWAGVYEDHALSVQYCDAHYGEEYFGVPNGPKRCAAISLEVMDGRRKESALDLGCSVGRAAFELARGGFRRVTGVDFSSRFVALACRIREEGCLCYALPEEGEILSPHRVSLADLGLDGVRDRVGFHRADACNLPGEFTGYDLVLAANIIDRLRSPGRFVSSIHTRINPGGVLVITSPYTWLEEFTRKGEWLGGYHEGGKPVRSLDNLGKALSPHFRMLGEPRDVPFVIRETGRKFQYVISELTVWELL